VPGIQADKKSADSLPEAFQVQSGVPEKPEDCRSDVSEKPDLLQEQLGALEILADCKLVVPESVLE
jgi:hypothetical protein